MAAWYIGKKRKTAYPEKRTMTEMHAMKLGDIHAGNKVKIHAANAYGMNKRISG